MLEFLVVVDKAFCTRRWLTWILHVLHYPICGRLHTCVVCVVDGFSARLKRETHLTQHFHHVGVNLNRPSCKTEPSALE